MPKDYPRRKINLVDRPEWSDYDLTGNLGINANDAGWQMVSDMRCSDIDDLAEQVLSMGSKKKKWHIVEDGVQEALCEAFRRGDTLETFRQLVSDAAVWSVEAAFTPTKGDLQDALDKAIDNVSRDVDLDDYEALRAIAGNESGPVDYTFLNCILSNATIFIAQEEGHYDRFLIYDPFDNDYAQNLIKKPQMRMCKFEARGVLDWMPGEALEVPSSQVKADLVRLFSDLKENIITDMFANLKTDMEDLNVENRVDFSKHWKNILQDGPEVKAAKKELQDFLKAVNKEAD